MSDDAVSDGSALPTPHLSSDEATRVATDVLDRVGQAVVGKRHALGLVLAASGDDRVRVVGRG